MEKRFDVYGNSAGMEMTGERFEAITSVVGALVSASVTLLRDGTVRMPHGSMVGAAVSAVLVPMMLPKVGATLRRVLHGSDAVRSEIDRDGELHTDALNELARKNARLARELSDLRSAYAELANDAAQQAQTVERLAHLAHHDALTQLPNRMLLMDRLTQAIEAAERARTGVLVLYLDLDNFKTINDTMGHAAGDTVLSEVAARIAKCAGAGATASRVGGDEFVVVYPTDDAVRDAAQLRVRMQQAFEAPVDVDGIPVSTGASIGTSVFPVDGRDPAALLCKADYAMYGAKFRSSGRAVR